VLHALPAFLVMNHQFMAMNHLKKGHPLLSYLLLHANYSALSLLFKETVTERVYTALILMLVMIYKDF